MKDYSSYREGNRFYTGAERKKSIIINNKNYIIKFRSNSREGYRFNHVSEYIGSHIFSMLGIYTQETALGMYKGEEVVLMKDFLSISEVFVPFNGVGDSSLERDKDRYRYTYDEIMDMLRDNIKLTCLEESIEMFWDMFIVDALIANFDRHGSNWGFIKKDNKYRMAPVFDNGSCLFPQLNTDKKIEMVLNSQEEIESRIYKFPTSQIKYNGKKSSYYDVISSLQYDQCNNALKRIVRRVSFDKIDKLINDIDIISDIHKEFYKTILRERYEKILYSSYKKLR